MIDRLMRRRHGRSALAFLRAAMGFVMVCFYLWNAPLRNALWGAHGVLPYGDYIATTRADPLQLYRYSPAHSFTEALFWISLAVALLYAFGVTPRLLAVPFAVTAYATISRNWPATDAGLNLLILLSFLLCLCDTSARFSVVTIRPWRSLARAVRPIANVAHNCGRFLISWQVCMVYFWAAFYKLGGQNWRDGTALYYVLHVQHFAVFPVVSNFLAGNSLLVALATYGTVVFQMGFPFLMWDERAKPFLISGAVALHTGIAILMGLMLFSATMIAADISLLSDRQFLALRRLARSTLALVFRPVIIVRRRIAIRPLVGLCVLLGAIVLCHGQAHAAAEFCPATVEPVAQRVSDAQYAFRLGAMSARNVTGTFFVETDKGWFAADFKDVPLRPFEQTYTDESTFGMNDYLSGPLMVTFPSAVKILYEFVRSASTHGETILGWDTEGTVSCEPTGRRDPKRRSGYAEPDPQPFDVAGAVAITARAVPVQKATNCDEPFSLARIKQISYARYPALFNEAAGTALPKGATISIVALNADGSILDSWLWETSGNQALDQAALDAAKKTTYAPARAFCENVPSYYFMKVSWGH